MNHIKLYEDFLDIHTGIAKKVSKLMNKEDDYTLADIQTLIGKSNIGAIHSREVKEVADELREMGFKVNESAESLKKLLIQTENREESKKKVRNFMSDKGYTSKKSQSRVGQIRYFYEVEPKDLEAVKKFGDDNKLYVHVYENEI